MAWKLVAGGVKLRDQLNARFPNRDKSSDGAVGDLSHQARPSDHNPDKNGWVHALDIDENFGKGKWRNGRNAQALADQIVAYAASGLPGSDRVKNVVYNDKVASGTYRATRWVWRGKGYGHFNHIHISFTSKAQKDGQLWPLPILGRTLRQRRLWAKNLKDAKK
jgi:hypothetical protein